MSTLTQKNRVDDFHWPTVGESGRVPIDSVIENPRNPRTYFDDDETEAMASSIKKGRQREIATVRLIQPSDAVPQGVRYMLTSGARRYRGARKAGETHFEIRVKEYESLGEEMLDALMLNEDRKPVSDLELGRYYRDLMIEKGWTQTELANAISRSLFWVSDRIMILRCTDKVQARMHPQQKSRMLNLQVGIALSKMQPELQDELIEAMPPELETAASQLHWLETQINIRGVEVPRRKRQPKTYRGMLEAFATTMKQKADFALSPDFNRLFENTSDLEAHSLAREMREALREFEKLVVLVEKLAAGEKKQTMLIPRDQMPWGRKQVLESTVAAPAANTARLQVVTINQPEKPLSTHAQSKRQTHMDDCVRAGNARVAYRAPPPHPHILSATNSPGGITVNVRFEREPGKFYAETVSLRRYMELWDAGKLEFQVKKEPRPSNYPNRKDLHG